MMDQGFFQDNEPIMAACGKDERSFFMDDFGYFGSADP